MVDRDRSGDLQPPGPAARQGFERAGGRNQIHQKSRAGLLDQGQVAFQPHAFRDGGSGRQAQARGQFAGGGDGTLHQAGIGRAAGDQGVEGGGVAHHPLQGSAVGDDAVAVGEIEGPGLVHQADLGHTLAIAGLGGGPGGANVNEVQGRPAPLDEVDHRRVVDGGVGVGLDDDGGDAAGRRRLAGGFQRLLGLGAGFAGLDPDVDQAGGEA